jgi:hypothetical protein
MRSGAELAVPARARRRNHQALWAGQMYLAEDSVDLLPRIWTTRAPYRTARPLEFAARGCGANSANLRR